MINYCDSYWNDIDSVIDNIPDIKKIYNKSILITGATGMICSTVVDVLIHLNKFYNANIKIFLAGRNRERIQKRFYNIFEDKDYSFIAYDATKTQELNIAVDYIIHGASNANPTIYTKEPVETMLANIVGLNNLLKMAVKANSKRVLYVSSSEVYGNINEVRPYKEDDYGYVNILNPRASYPCSKRAAETLCIAYGDEHNLDTVIVRPGHIYGPSITDFDTRASAQFTRNAVQKENIIMKSAGTQLRSYCYTLDCASAIIAVLLNGEKGNAYNISNKESICTISDIANALANSSNVKVEYEDPTALEKKGYNLMSNSSLDSTKLEELGWKAIFDLQEGTKRTVKYFSV